MMGGKWPYRCCFVSCCFQNLFQTVRSILEYFSSNSFSMHFVGVYVVRPYSSRDTATAWKKICFILSDRSDLHKINKQSIAVSTFAKRMLTSISVGKILLPGYVNLSTCFRGLPLKVDIAPSRFKSENFYLRSREGHCLFLLASGYLGEIRFVSCARSSA